MDKERYDYLEASRLDAIKNIRETQMKYIYYVIALNVASVAFTMNQIKDDKINTYHIWLGLGILMWSCGVYFGFYFLSKYKLVLHQWQNRYLYELKNKNQSIEVQKAMYIKFDELTVKTQNEGEIGYRNSLLCFYLGCGFFIAWQIVQMTFFNQDV